MVSHSDDSAHDSGHEGDDSAHDSGHESDDSAHDSGHESERQPQKKFTHRGMTVKKNIINRGNKGLPKLTVVWNAKNQPIGPNGKQLQTFIGARARQDIPITIKSWTVNKKKKDDPYKKLKDELWHMIQKYFDVDDSRKDYCLRKAGKAHRRFRSTLTKWAHDEEGNARNHPPPRYDGIITPEDWSAFVSSREIEEFQILSNENRERAKSPEYPYRAGVTGYPDIEERLLREAGKDPSEESIDRSVLWLEARKNKERVIDDPKTREVSQRIESISQSVSQGEITDCDGPNDILGRALATEEYSGRLRGLGFGISPTTLWVSKRQKKEEERENRERRLEAMVLMLHKELNELKARGVVARTNDVSSSNPDSLRGSCNIASNEVNNGYCELYISNPVTLVAKGIVCNNEDSTLHNLPMPPNHARVKVEIVVVGDAELPVPIDTAEMTLLTVSDALGTFVAWPSNLINVNKARSQISRHVGKSQRSPSEAPKKHVSRRVDKGKEIQSQPSTSIAPKKSVSRQIDKGKEIQSQPSPSKEFITYIKIHAATMTNGDLINVLIDSDILGVVWHIPISQYELKEVYDHKWASHTTILIYIRYLFYEIMSPMDLTQKFIFLCPEHTHLLNLCFRNDASKKKLQN